MRIPPVLILSLAANLALGVMVARRPAIRALFNSPANPIAAAGPVSADSAHGAGSAKDAAGGAWSELASGSEADIIARLRAEGVPPRILRAIAGVLMAERFADQRRAILKAMAVKPWWRGTPWEEYSDPEITAMQRKLKRDSRQALYDLLGPQAPDTDYDRAWAQRKYGPLSPEQTEKFRQINQDYDDLAAEVRAQAHGIILPEDREKLALFDEEKRKDIAALLTPDELLEFNLRSGPTAKRVRDQLASFDPTEEEYRAIFKIQQAVDAQFGDGRIANLTQEERRQRRDLINSTTDQVRAVLSPDRFAEYQIKTDPAYAPTSELVASLALSPSITAQVVAAQKDITARMQAVVADRTLSGEQRTAQFADLAQQATQTLTGTLGPDGLNAYKQKLGNWLNNLERRAQPRVAPAVPNP